MQIRRLTMVKLLGSHALGNHGGVWLLGRGLTPTNRVREPPSSVGDPLPGPTPSQLKQFGDGQVHFEEEETAEDGPGPVFNNTACVACHSSPAIGGDSNILETRFGRIWKNKFVPMTAFDGSLIQSRESPRRARAPAKPFHQRRTTSRIGRQRRCLDWD
jgi:hypothetical protein